VLGNEIYAKVFASNVKGDSPESLEGNGATIITKPDAPENFMENYAQRSASTLGLQWTAGFNGGSEILDYRVWMAVLG
jgi:hypothetical protein